jgi:thioredoxin-like negative regulator of GroEL
VRDGAVRWLASRNEARAVARLANRPVLVYAMHPTCPLCRAMEGGTLADPSVGEAAERFVPLRLDVTALAPEEARDLFAAGWPYFAVETADGREVAAFGGMRDATDFRQELDAAWEARPAGSEAVPWPDAEAAAREADWGIRARDALLAARDLAPANPARARETLVRAASDLAGTRQAEDLALVLGRWDAEGRFPRLAESLR